MRPGDDLVLRPMADGGEGTLDAFAAAVPGAERIPVTVRGPDDRPVDAAWLRLPDGSALVELAGTSGLTLLDALRPLDAHTFGFGEAVASALDAGATRLLLAIGGSSSTDAGAGALAALGASFRDHEGREVVGGARGLAEVASVDVSSLRALPPGGASILCDVTNPCSARRARPRSSGRRRARRRRWSRRWMSRSRASPSSCLAGRPSRRRPARVPRAAPGSGSWRGARACRAEPPRSPRRSAWPARSRVPTSW
ncbi:hypothetical protein GCM10025870_10340 [Agromyces marinus]|uniref:Glycerate kinase n=1 Tax=Agromyces marinus TaxID=1389020 RepID=A0ABM8GZP4_9MICO|nr:hypothetical protein GCM10025870_10340 [Agromyces marinus]